MMKGPVTANNQAVNPYAAADTVRDVRKSKRLERIPGPVSIMNNLRAQFDQIS
jgi:hypothetical protein